MALTSLEVCAGAGGQALGLEQAGFDHAGLVEIDPHACATLRLNRPSWEVHQTDLEAFDGRPFRGVDLFAGGLPCPPFSVAGRQLGSEDERNLFPAAFRLIDEMRPRAVMIENVRGLMSPMFEGYREHITQEFARLGYKALWSMYNAADFGVSQMRPRVAIVALPRETAAKFSWPMPAFQLPPTVGALLEDLMGANGWDGAAAWAKGANAIAPTIVGGSKKHGGPDLGPTRARAAWAQLGVNGLGIADAAPGPGFQGLPKLTVRMVARIQGFPDEWEFSGKKTNAYRQVGNAFPPPFARAIASAIKEALESSVLVQGARLA